VKGIVEGMTLTLKHFFSKPVTVQYPKARLEQKDRFRGELRMVIDPESKEPHCTACGLCAKACPDRLIIIKTEKVDKKRVMVDWQFNLGACMFCGLCVEACPFGAITMSKEFELAVYNPKRLHYNKERLEKRAITRPKKKAAKKEKKPESDKSDVAKKAEDSGKEATPEAGTQDKQDKGIDQEKIKEDSTVNKENISAQNTVEDKKTGSSSGDENSGTTQLKMGDPEGSNQESENKED